MREDFIDFTPFVTENSSWEITRKNNGVRCSCTNVGRRRRWVLGFLWAADDDDDDDEGEDIKSDE